MMPRLYDAHAHFGTAAERKEREEKEIVTLLCGTCQEEIQRVQRLAGEGGQFPSWIIPTFGLHPWHAGEDQVDTLIPFLLSCRLIGEIGMDSVWCKVPLKLQEEVFLRQLELAADLKKPVILHTKGQEKRIAGLINQFPNTYLVHWYSGEVWVEDYLQSDCYFTIGPDVWWNPAVQRIVTSVPRNRLLIETDGLGAVAWAYEAGGRRIRPEELSVEAALLESVSFMAGMLNETPEGMLELLCQNFKTFLSAGDGKQPVL